jgi:hypothetical protein
MGAIRNFQTVSLRTRANKETVLFSPTRSRHTARAQSGDHLKECGRYHGKEGEIEKVEHDGARKPGLSKFKDPPPKASGLLGDYWKSLPYSGVTPTSMANFGDARGTSHWRISGKPNKLRLLCIPSCVWRRRSGC